MESTRTQIWMFLFKNWLNSSKILKKNYSKLHLILLANLISFLNSINLVSITLPLAFEVCGWLEYLKSFNLNGHYREMAWLPFQKVVIVIFKRESSYFVWIDTRKGHQRILRYTIATKLCKNIGIRWAISSGNLEELVITCQSF